uniref:Uncharacterized protein n=1 Tax=Anguilla anguilla TaxID=7936 RepID=A0A0E9T7H6_ANGAN
MDGCSIRLSPYFLHSRALFGHFGVRFLFFRFYFDLCKCHCFMVPPEHPQPSKTSTCAFLKSLKETRLHHGLHLALSRHAPASYRT